MGPDRQGVLVRNRRGARLAADLFRGRSQLLVYHFMFGPDYTAGCPSCSAIADGFDGFVVHLANHDVMLWAVSRAPLAKLQAYKRRMGWTFPWASSFGSDFNFDFSVWFTEEQQREGGIEYNYQREEPLQWRAAKNVGEIPSRRHPTGRQKRCQGRDRCGDVSAREARHERLRDRGRHRLPHLLRLRPRSRRALGRLPVARPGTEGPQRNRFLVPPSRRVRQALSKSSWIPSELPSERFLASQRCSSLPAWQSQSSGAHPSCVIDGSTRTWRGRTCTP